jgi:hypothetical protein
MRCVQCGWLVRDEACPCGHTKLRAGNTLVPLGRRVVFRAGRGPHMFQWGVGEVTAHQGRLHSISTRGGGSYWCEIDDLLPDSPERAELLNENTRVWAMWIDGQWFPGVIDGVEGPIRHVCWDDGDSMWVESIQIVVMAAANEPLREGAIVLANHWNGDMQPGRIEQLEGYRYRVVFGDGEEDWFSADDLTTLPPNPFNDA